MLSFVLAALVAAAPEPVDTRPRLLVMDLGRDSGIDANTVTALTEFLTAWLAESKKFAVSSKRELVTMADLEAERQKADCTSESCVNELADALGARYVVFGRVGKLGSSFYVHITLADVKNAMPADRRVIQAPDLDQLSEQLHAAARSMTGSVKQPERLVERAERGEKTEKEKEKKKETTAAAPPPPASPPRVEPVRSVGGDDDDEEEVRVPSKRTMREMDKTPTGKQREVDAAAARVAQRKAAAAELRKDFDGLAFTGTTIMASGVVLGLSTLAATLVTNNEADPFFYVGGCALCAVGTGIGGIVWTQAMEKQAEADEIDPPKPH